MNRIILTALFMATAFAADAPTLSDKDKLKLREIQVKVTQLDAQKARMESQYNQISTDLTKATAELELLVKQMTPAGYVLQADLSLVEQPKTQAAK